MQKTMEVVDDQQQPAADVDIIDKTETDTETPATLAVGHNDSEKNKPTRRYWSQKEEERLFEIWGRDNWRLTRHGKNTLYFSRWSEEMQNYDIDVKPEEVQAKVNQTRSKYRQVKKQIESSDGPIVRWKKFDLIEKILRNEYRPQDAEELPASVHENNRDFSSSELARQQHSSPPTNMAIQSTTTSEQQPQPVLAPSAADSVTIKQEVPDVTPNTASVNSTNVNLFNTTDNCEDMSVNTSNNSELFSNNISVKEEPNDFHESAEDVQMNEQQQKQQDENYQQPTLTNNANAVNANTATAIMSATAETNLHNMQTLQKQEQINSQLCHVQQQQQNNQNNNAIANNTNNTINTHGNNNNNTNNLKQMNINNNSNVRTITIQRSTSTPTTSAPSRKRRAQPTQVNNYNNALTHATPTAAAAAPSASYALNNNNTTDSLEFMYMEEVRKKNRLLDEQKEIAHKRLQVEERKLALMEQFFPKYLAMQESILQKMNTN